VNIGVMTTGFPAFGCDAEQRAARGAPLARVGDQEILSAGKRQQHARQAEWCAALKSAGGAYDDSGTKIRMPCR